MRDGRLRERHDLHDLAADAGATRSEHAQDLESSRMRERPQLVG
jgi:hypothetical protein